MTEPSNSTDVMCKLCGRPEPLRKSHIIPEFCYKTLYSEKHRLDKYQLSAEPVKSNHQKGFWERLFCDRCEDRFNDYETYMSNLWFSDRGLPVSVAPNTLMLRFANIDYKLFKLFHLSILFRASVASIPFFKSVALGKNEAVLRQMLLNNDPGAEAEFPFLCTVLHFPTSGHVCRDIIVEPVQSHRNGKYCYTFVFAGCSWLYYGSRSGAADMPITSCLKENGDLQLVLQSIVEHPLTRELAFNHLKRQEEANGAG